MKILIYLIIFIIFFIGYVRYLEKSTLFFPERTIFSKPSDIGLSYEDVYFPTEDHLQLHGWFIKSSKFSLRNTLIFFHGNAGNIGDRLGKLKLFDDLGLNVLIVGYRGYGKSEGKPTEEGIYKDARAAYDYLITRDDVDPHRIMAYGASLGAAAAVDLATKRELSKLILDSSFSSAVDMAKVIYPFIPSFFN